MQSARGQASEPSWASTHDVERASGPGGLAEREADWRNGALVYQVIVDRFAPSADLEAKRALYPAPKKLRQWSETPKAGEKLPDVGVCSHEIDFWGGDLASLRGKLDYIQQLGCDVLYLNPIQLAYTNHKYDAQDYFAVSPEYGSREDVKGLAADLHKRGMRLVLDGVFNHMGKSAPSFQEALGDPSSRWREWFFIGPQYELGYRAWADVVNLPEVRMENPEVRARLFGDADSVVQGYLRDGVDGWRLDVASDLGFNYLQELTEGAHRAKAQSLVVGEIWSYPEEWSPAVDAVLNVHFRKIVFGLMEGQVSGAQAGRMLERMVADAGLGPILKSWLVLDNHDLPRLKTALPEVWQQHLAQVLQFTLPGSPCVYYGVELGMVGGWDPENRAPMRWDLVTEDNADRQWMRRLIELRRGSRALRIGDFRLLDSEKLLAFLRRTDRVAETRVVVVNASDTAVTELLTVRDSKLMNWEMMKDELSDTEMRIECGTILAEVPARTALILRPAAARGSGHSPYKRVQ